jgi:hypothetical protein
MLVRGGKVEHALEFKASSAPTVTAGFHAATSQLSPTLVSVVHPGPDDGYPSGDGTETIGLLPLVRRLRGHPRA